MRVTREHVVEPRQQLMAGRPPEPVVANQQEEHGDALEKWLVALAGESSSLLAPQYAGLHLSPPAARVCAGDVDAVPDAKALELIGDQVEKCVGLGDEHISTVELTDRNELEGERTTY